MEYRTRVLGLAFLANFSQFGSRVVISPLIPLLIGAFEVDKSTFGAVLTLLWAVFALFQYPGGLLAGRYGERRIIILSMGLTAIGCFLLALAPTFLTFAVAAIVLGAGSGLYFAVGTSLLNRTFGGEGSAFGLHSSGGPVAGVILPVAATTIAVAYDWRVAIAGAGCIALAVAALYILLCEPTPPRQPHRLIRDGLTLARVRELFDDRAVVFTTVLSIIGMFTFQSFVSWFPSFLQEYHHLTESTASVFFGVVFGLIAIFLPIVGALGDRFGIDRAVVPAVLTTALGIVLVLVVSSTPAIAMAVGLLGIGLSWGGALQARFMEALSMDDAGPGFGLARTIYILVGSVGNVITGVLVELRGWPTAFGLVVVLLSLFAGSVVLNRWRGWGL